MDTIPKFYGKIKLFFHDWVTGVNRALLWAQSESGRGIAYICILMLATWSAFVLGKMSATQVATVGIDVTHRQPYVVSESRVVLGSAPKGKTIVASRKGKKYHRVDCPGARTISEKNKRYFTDEAEAKRAGLTPASNCPGLQ
jgi:hypothetical protein